MNIDLKSPQNLDEFFPWLKVKSEKLWATRQSYSRIPLSTKWLPGLTDNQIINYEKEMGFTFPEVYKMYLRNMNGTEKYVHTWWEESSGWSAEYGYSAGSRKREDIDSFYSYSRDAKYLKEKFGWIFKQNELDREGIPHLIPIVSHRFLVIDRCEINPVLSIYEDVLPYADSLENFLLNDIFFKGRQQPDLPVFKVQYWLDDLVSSRKPISSEEMRLATIIGDNYVVSFGDCNFDQKADIIRRFLSDGKRVRLFIVYKGQKIRQPEVGLKLLKSIAEALKGVATIEKRPEVQKKEWMMILAPLQPAGN